MLKKRVIPLQLLRNKRLHKSVKFDEGRDVGNPVTSSKVYADQDADEIILLNISREARRVDDMVDILKDVTKHCFVPVAVGGGIVSLDDAKTLFRSGADKIVVNSAAYRRYEFIEELAAIYGRQAIIVGIDVKKKYDEEYNLYSNCGRNCEAVSLREHIARIERAGAGEVFIQSIDRDGTMEGYDLNLLHLAMKYSHVPLIAAGGAGNYSHLLEGLSLGVDAVSCGSLFNFGDNNPVRAKSFLSNNQIPVKKV
jgi:cyclase